MEQAETFNNDGPAVRKEAGRHNWGQISLTSIGNLIKTLQKSVHGQLPLVMNAYYLGILVRKKKIINFTESSEVFILSWNYFLMKTLFSSPVPYIHSL